MNRRLYMRLALIIIGIAAGIVIISSVILILKTHYHFIMYQSQVSKMDYWLEMNGHLELALLQTILWTSLVSIVLAIILGFYVAKRISTPLVHMKHVAEKMTVGEWHARVSLSGKDELAELGASLNTLAVQLQNQEQLRVTMTENIAHELRTPLATLKSHMRALEDGIWEPTPARIHTCYEEIERLTKLVAELEDLTQLESPGFKLVQKEESLAEVIERAVHLVDASYQEKQVFLNYTVDPTIRVFIDHGRMIQVMVNLLSNALKFTPAHGEVNITASEEQAGIRIVVEDSGSGIPSEDLPNVFERFYRADKSRSRRTGGSGLGLTIVKQLISAHGGQIQVKSEQGTTFTIRIPKISHQVYTSSS
ncbi:ATP-binding protein [Paenibacillus sp. GCM10012307]|uniref:histidine kinase n=1 Tax=Paenibacillus roseus TaxID=2798579 RepID=A0A934MLU6_9BACL|nr:HAMP domain-containing sensor histidine kinase [Paenibacillus roseus]MBJ6362590.1 HAMP domain-containing histidine kinase [Paenibacillus roseus]